jgi:hypothetical protein
MNERIKELYKQAAQFGQDDYNNRRRNRGPLYEEDELTNIVNQKFAELIVRECAKLVEDNMDSQNAWITPGFIKQHFGVRE